MVVVGADHRSEARPAGGTAALPVDAVVVVVLPEAAVQAVVLVLAADVAPPAGAAGVLAVDCSVSAQVQAAHSVEAARSR